MDRIETTILRNLVNNQAFVQKAFPFIKAEYFKDGPDKIVFEHIAKYIAEYDKTPTMESLVISVRDDHSIPEALYTKSVELIYDLIPVEGTEFNWLMDQSEKFCKERAVYNAVASAVEIIDGKQKDVRPDAIPQMLEEALSVCFDTAIGHDFFDNAEERFDHYHRKEEKIPFDIEYFNKITEGGLPKKTISCLLAGTNSGKSLVMCHVAASMLAAGKNVLYITMEMSELVTSLRIDANLLNVDISDVKKMSKDSYLGRLKRVQNKTHGKLVVKEYPTSGAHVGHFKALLNELRLKKDFVPDLIVVDYLNICLSQRVKNVNANSYTVVKSIAEELRGLAVEYNLPILTATQTTRGGNGKSDLEITDVSESIGLAATVDMLLGIIRTPELDSQNQLMFKLLKSRFVDAASYGAFVVGVERSKMRLYDLEPSAQDGIGENNYRPPIAKKHEMSNNDDVPFSGASFRSSKAGADFSDFNLGE